MPRLPRLRKDDTAGEMTKAPLYRDFHRLLDLAEHDAWLELSDSRQLGQAIVEDPFVVLHVRHAKLDQAIDPYNEHVAF